MQIQDQKKPAECKVYSLGDFGIKSDFRLGGNFLKGQVGDAINLLLAAAASNLSYWMKQVLFALYSEIRKLAENFVRLHRPLPA